MSNGMLLLYQKNAAGVGYRACPQLSSGERSSQRRWGSGNLLCSCERMLAGAGREVAGCPPSSDGSSEVQTLRSPQLRRGKPHRRTCGGALSSGECPSHRGWGSGNLLCSCERMLTGAGREIEGCPPSSNGSSEVQTWRSPQLRRGGPRRRTGVGALSSGEYPSHRRWGSGNLLCSCERMLAGAGRKITGCPPSSDGSSEAKDLRSPQLRRGMPHRSWTRSKYPALHEPSAAKQKPPLARA